MCADLVSHPLPIALITHPHFLICVTRHIPIVLTAPAAYHPISIYLIANLSYNPHFRQWCLLFRNVNLNLQLEHSSVSSFGSHTFFFPLFSSTLPTDYGIFYCRFFGVSLIRLYYNSPPEFLNNCILTAKLF